jgi:hypothetical protein
MLSVPLSLLLLIFLWLALHSFLRSRQGTEALFLHEEVCTASYSDESTLSYEQDLPGRAHARAPAV